MRPSPRCPRLRPRDARAYPRNTARAASSPRCPPKLPDAAPHLLHHVQPARQSSAPRSQSGRRRHHGSLRNPQPRARSPELRWAPALAPDTMLCPTLNLATTPSTTPPSFLATTPSLDGRRDWWHLPDLGARLILAPNAALPPIRAASSDGSQDNASSPSPEPRRLTFEGCRSAILTSSSLAVARPPDRHLRPRDPPDSPTSLSTATSITHLLHADEKARPPLSPRPPTTRLLNKGLYI
jgi:hypothetical protein